jgi:hypothetical protein
MRVKGKGPVFATAFSPLRMIIVAVMGSIILYEKIYLGRFVISNFSFNSPMQSLVVAINYMA